MPESIDVIIACYNEAETIENVILDHLKVLENSQTFDEYLITVIDDGSTDDSRAKINRIVTNHKNVKFIQSEKPSGIHEALINWLNPQVINGCILLQVMGNTQ